MQMKMLYVLKKSLLVLLPELPIALPQMSPLKKMSAVGVSRKRITTEMKIIQMLEKRGSQMQKSFEISSLS